MTEDEVFTKGYELGKREAEQRIASEIEQLRDRLIRLETWLEGDAYCPCCTGAKECSEGCSFAEDDPDANERTLDVRYVLYGGG